MVKMNFIALLVATLVPLVIGFVYYHRSVFGAYWASQNGFDMSDDSMKKRMPVIMIVSLIVSFMAALALQGMVIHQFGFFSLLMPDSAAVKSAADVHVSIGTAEITDWANRFRTFQHGAFHGALAAIFMVTPIIVTSGLYEKKTAKYMFMSIGYWLINFIIMGGIICAWV